MSIKGLFKGLLVRTVKKLRSAHIVYVAILFAKRVVVLTLYSYFFALIICVDVVVCESHVISKNGSKWLSRFAPIILL